MLLILPQPGCPDRPHSDATPNPRCRPTRAADRPALQRPALQPPALQPPALQPEWTVRQRRAGSVAPEVSTLRVGPRCASVHSGWLSTLGVCSRTALRM